MKNIGNRYDWQALVIVTVLMLIGVGILWGTGLFKITSISMFVEWFWQFGMVLIFAGFFIGVGIYCWWLYICNVLIKPKERILFLKSIEDEMCTFVDKRGKVFYFSNDNYTVNTYYAVLKTKDHIHSIVGPAMDNFEIKKERPSYWLNFYSPIGNFENIFLLPIVYVIALPGICMLFYPGLIEKIIGTLMSLPCVLIILYDLKEKIRRSKDK